VFTKRPAYHRIDRGHHTLSGAVYLVAVADHAAYEYILTAHRNYRTVGDEGELRDPCLCAEIIAVKLAWLGSWCCQSGKCYRFVF